MNAVIRTIKDTVTGEENGSNKGRRTKKKKYDSTNERKMIISKLAQYPNTQKEQKKKRIINIDDWGNNNE